MVDNPIIPFNSIKSRMDDLFIFSSQVPYGKKHPLRVVQASKSLIGINLESPPRILLKWLDDYIKDFIPNFITHTSSDQNSLPETITYTHLGKLILNKQADESIIHLTHLLQVADPRHIAEFLMELGAKQSPGSFLFCWSAFRSIQFLGEKNGNPILYHCLSKLLDVGERRKNNRKLLLEKYELYYHIFQVRKTEMVRKSKIIPHLDRMIQTIELELHQTPPLFVPITLRSIIKTDGIQGIISYISTLKLEDISTDLILLLDALRSALRFSDNLADPVLLYMLDNRKENDYVE